jgi:hypothetical protein
MSDPKDPTADYRKYPKGPNFLGIVIGSSIALIVILVVAYFVLGLDAGKLMPHRPNPQPNSLAQPLLPLATPAAYA